jgi:hypothetical protein
MMEVDRLVAENARDGQLEALDAGLQAAQQDEANGMMSRQRLLAVQRAYEVQRYAIVHQEAVAEAALEPDPVKHQQLLNKILQMERQHGTQMAALDRQVGAEHRQTVDTWVNGLTSSWAEAMQGLIQGTMTWGQAFRTILSGMSNFLIQESMRMVTKWIADRVYEMIFGKATRIADITGAASLYSVNAMASVAAIPVTGWAMAPAVGAAALAEGLAFLPSAAGGWERVPQDTLAAIHKDEQVLPSSYAEGLRNLVASGGVGDVHAHFYGVVDAKTFFQNNQGHIVSTIKGAIGNRRFA